jgi:hypothetical protein
MGATTCFRSRSYDFNLFTIKFEIHINITYMRYLLLLACTFLLAISHAQVGIGTTTPDLSSKLDVSATDKGFLPPRVALSSTNPAGNVIASPAEGLLIYNTATAGSGATAVTPGYYYFNGSKWVKIYSEGNFIGKPGIILNTAATVTSNTAQISGNIITDGGANILERGFVTGGESMPNIITGIKITVLGTTGAMNTKITTNNNTTIYVRAYATTDNGITFYSNEISFTTLAAGYPGPAGGTVIFDKGYISDGWRYLEMAPVDQSTGAPWGCMGTSIGTTDSIGSGKGNTTAIVNGCADAGIAAKLCTAYSLNGYTDWFLPSMEELYLINLNGPNNPNNYWSSMEVDASSARFRNLGGGVFSTAKSVNVRVRAIRAY